MPESKNIDIALTATGNNAILSGSAMCRHCRHLFSYSTFYNLLSVDKKGSWLFTAPLCPGCGNANVAVGCFPKHGGLNTSDGIHYLPNGDLIVRWDWPIRADRLCPPEVPSEFAKDYREAASVLRLSPTASAALSRRCLQHVLREKGPFAQHNLAEQIKAAASSNTLPEYITNDLNTIRIIGNFAAHPMKETASGQVLDVEPGEAEWNLDVLDTLFEFYFVAPAERDARKAALNAKLVAAGKPPVA